MLPIFKTVGDVTKKCLFEVKKYSPQIMIVGGVVGGIAGTVLACIKTKEALDVIEDAEIELEAIQSTLDAKLDYTKEEAQKDRFHLYTHTAGKLVKIYAGPGLILVGSAAGILCGTGILNKRNAGLAASVASTTLSMNEYRKRLIDHFGEEEGKKLDKEFRYGLKETEIKEEVIDENGKKKTIKRKVKVLDENTKRVTNYTRILDWTNPHYDNNLDYLLFFARAQQSYFNDKLYANRYVFMNDVDEALGFPKTKAGQIVGWRRDNTDEKIDNYIDFSIQEDWALDEYGLKRPILLLEYNVDGSILDKVDWEETDG